MSSRSWVGTLFIVLSLAGQSYGQAAASDLRIFGYFQPQFFHQTAGGGITDGDIVIQSQPASNSFALQQLNLFLQKDLGTDLVSFVNFEAVNSYSSDQKWGSFRLEEAWVRYRESRNLNLKLGLQIPIFNNLNEIKNRSPLIPYVIRPLVYESSFVDEIAIRTYVPQQAFVQVYGWLPVGNFKIDYAAYLGNTELVNSGFNTDASGRPKSRTGTDTTTSVMIGGRAGIRYGELKAGFSATTDNSSVLDGAENFTGFAGGRYASTPRRRLGADLSYFIDRVSFEAEWIDVALEEPEEISLELSFYYATVGYRITEKLLGYASYWLTREKQIILGASESVNVKVPGFGLAYVLEDQITLKAQYADVDIDIDISDPKTFRFQGTNSFRYFTVAVSVIF